MHRHLTEKAGYPAISIERRYGTLPAVECYPGQLNQVFMNLLANAIDALEEASQRRENNFQGHIILRTSRFTHQNIDWVEIAVADTGLGISNESQARIFDTFYTTKPVGRGTGMGLSISHTIITKKHHGNLFCRSIPGEGSEFIIQIPVVAAASTAALPLTQSVITERENKGSAVIV